MISATSICDDRDKSSSVLPHKNNRNKETTHPVVWTIQGWRATHPLMQKTPLPQPRGTLYSVFCILYLRNLAVWGTIHPTACSGAGVCRHTERTYLVVDSRELLIEPFLEGLPELLLVRLPGFLLSLGLLYQILLHGLRS